MLSEKSTRTIRATLPAVGAAIDEIAAVFYTKLFAAHPELERDLFNRGNQASGAQRQALAGSIAAFASALIEHPDVRPDTMLTRIAHKHASLGISRDQYEIVCTHLFAALADVLGAAVTEEVAAAWDEVYWLMANALIAIEERLYAQAGAPDGDTWRDYRVLARFHETGDVVSFLVHPADGAPLPPFRPGQYVSVQVQLSDGSRQIRQYSLSGGRAAALQFTVKKINGKPDGAVSHHLHHHVHDGDTLRLSAPFGDITLDDRDTPVLLASAGIGCTPMNAMLTQLAATGSRRQVIAVHADRSQRSHAFRTELDQLVAKLPNATAHVWYERPEGPWPADRTGLIDLSTVPVPPETTAYLCGPLPFLRTARSQLLERGVRAADIHYEVFGPDLWIGQPDNRTKRS
ncbi:globin domain-containing protein [Streptomyces sp. NPDC054933]